MPETKLEQLRRELVDINFAILHLLNKRASTVLEVQKIKEQEGLPLFMPDRELAMLRQLLENNPGPFPDKTVENLFKEIFRAGVALMERQQEKGLVVSRGHRKEDLVIEVGGRTLGKDPVIIAGPCSVESEAQMEMVGSELARLGIGFLRGGTFKPRSSPYAFQGMGEAGLKILADVARRHNLVSVTEVMDTRTVALVASYVDVLQIGARNMHNYELLREVGRCSKPIVLKRGLSATMDEFLWAAEYIANEGNDRVILCERGIRTFETQTRNTLDVSAIAVLRQKSYLPVIADVSHAAGRKDILVPLARASLAAGAQGVMVEVHPFPAVARSDSTQQLDLAEFGAFLKAVAL